MIASLEENRLTAEAERLSAEQLHREVEELKRRLDEEQRRFEEERGKLLAKAERDAAEAVAKARREADGIIADLRRMALEEGARVKEHQLIDVKRRLDEAVPELAPKRADARNAGKKTRPLQPGDEVLVPSVGQKGVIVDIGANEATVQLGILKMKVALADLEPIKSAPQKRQPVQQQVTGLKRTRDENARLELDLRGKNIEESIIDVDHFLDESFLANFPQVYIIHGKGTGVLRSGIQDYLRRHRHVKSFRIGAYNEGGNGVTVVELN
jgi:DNA mismatch repair protein MutS2